MKSYIKRAITILLVFSMVFVTVCPVHADAITNTTTKIEDVGSGKMFIQETNEKLIAIGADNTTHIITVSIKYTSDPNTVYQWIFDDYPQEEFNMNSTSFWDEVIDYAEENSGEATEIQFTYEEVTADEPMVRSSAGADLREDIEERHGTEYSDVRVSTQVMGGQVFHMYENLWISIAKVGAHAWNNGITLASLVVSILGLAATTATMGTICGVLGIAFSVGSMTLSAGKLNRYTCTAHYNRYVRRDTGYKLATSDKVITYKGYEDADLNSSGRASIVPATQSVVYSISQTHFNSGIFDEAYQSYLSGN